LNRTVITKCSDYKLQLLKALILSSSPWHLRTKRRVYLQPWGLLLSLGMASLIAIRVSNDASAQGLLEGLEREQGDSGDVQSSCAPTQTGGGGTFDDGVSVGGTSAYDDYDADVEGGDSITTTGTTTNATSTTTTGGGGNQSTSEVRDHIQEACIALQVGDTQGALMFLDMALSALGDGGTQGWW
jgi:hypothetical protein